MPKTKHKRNKKLFADYHKVQAGESKMSDLIAKYGISQARIYEIINRYKLAAKEANI